jgi:type IV pilus assembly protein PilA
MSASGGASGPAPSWYTDPGDARYLRYWDGLQWTEHTSPATPPASAPGQPSRGGSNKGIWAIAIVAGILVLIVVIGILAAIAIPVYLSQRQKAADVSARADVSTLGKEVATWYVDHDGPPPSVENMAGEYWVDGVWVGTMSPNVILGTVSGTGATDWCVWVRNPQGDLKDFEYSAAGGLDQGTC